MGSSRSSAPPTLATTEIEIKEGITDDDLADALRISFEAFARKFQLGFRNADDFIRTFADTVDRSSCLVAFVNGRVAGLLTIKLAETEFFDIELGSVFSSFNPIRATRILLNLGLLSSGSGNDEITKGQQLMIDTLAVDHAFRGHGIGTLLLAHAEAKARTMGKQALTLSVISNNEGAIQLYKRVGFKKTRTQRWFLIRWLTGSPAVYDMVKPICGND